LDLRGSGPENVCRSWHIRPDSLLPSRSGFEGGLSARTRLMPGIESYGRGKQRTGSVKTPVQPDELAQILFSKVAADAATFMDNYRADFESCPTFRANDFERQKFTYLVASVAIALTIAAEKEDAFLEVIKSFRAMVRRLMQEYWGAMEDDSDL